jgi:hypothetical protein
MIPWTLSSPGRERSTWEVECGAAMSPPSEQDLAKFESRMQQLRREPIFGVLGRNIAALAAGSRNTDEPDNVAPPSGRRHNCIVTT